MAIGEAECTATQSVHLASSEELEWWCVAKLKADNSVSSRHNVPICFETDRIKATHQDREFNLHRN